MKLTDIVVRNLAAPASGQKLYPDDSLPGFGVRVSQGGTKTFTLVYGRDRERTSLGRYPVIGLADARTEAKRILAERTLGRLRPQPIKVDAALEQFFETHVAQKCNPTTQREVKRLLRKHFLPKVRHNQLGDVSTQDVMKVVDGLMGTPAECAHVFKVTKTFFRWAVRRRLIPHSPIEGLEAPVKAVSRDRVLTDEELATVLAHAEAAGSFGVFVTLLILTGQRKGEINTLKRAMIDQDRRTITLPVTKNGRPHTFPYGDAVAVLLDKSPPDGPLFPGRQRTAGEEGPLLPFNGFSKAMEQFRSKCRIPHWTLHDLRRTFATGLQRAGVRIEVTEALLNHVSGVRAGIVGIYQRHNYGDEMRAAQALWEKHVASLPKPVLASDCPVDLSSTGAVAMAPYTGDQSDDAVSQQEGTSTARSL